MTFSNDLFGCPQGSRDGERPTAKRVDWKSAQMELAGLEVPCRQARVRGGAWVMVRGYQLTV